MVFFTYHMIFWGICSQNIFKDSEKLFIREIEKLGARVYGNEKNPDAPLTVRIKGGKFQEGDFKKLKKLRNLESLIIDPNIRFSEEALVHLIDLEKLQGLILHMKISNKGLAHVAKFKNLKYLSLTDVDASKEGWAKLENHKTLEHLYCLTINDEGLAQLKGLKKLEYLCLNGSKVTNKGLCILEEMKFLKRLDMDRTAITDEGLIWVSLLKELSVLSLNNTEITDNGLEQIKKLKKLENLFVFGTKITENGIKSLKKSLPNVDIFYKLK